METPSTQEHPLEITIPKTTTTDERRAEAAQYRLSGVELTAILTACSHTESDFARVLFNKNYKSIDDNGKIALNKVEKAEVRRVLTSTHEVAPRYGWAMCRLVHLENYVRLAKSIVEHLDRAPLLSLEDTVQQLIKPSPTITQEAV
jgi:hypothetical protein